MNYNTSRDKLIMREYGRNVQSLVDYACTVEDKEERQRIAEFIIEVMTQINPQLKSFEEYRQKLWDHLFYMSDWKLDVESPYEKPDPDTYEKRYQSMQMTYPRQRIKYRHYGKNVETMVKKAIAMEDSEKQKAFAESIGNYMKMVYNSWNRDNITDEVIMNDFKMLSGGELTLEEDSNLDSLRRSNRSSRPSNHKNTRSGGRGKSNYRKKNYRKKR